MTTREDRMQSIIEYCVPFEGQKHFRDQLRDGLQQISNQTLRFIYEMVSSPQSKYVGYTFLLKLLAENSEQIIRETLFFRPLLTTVHERKNPLVKIIRGLHETEFFRPHRRLVELTDNNLSTAIAYIDITTAIYHMDNEASVLSNRMNNSVHIINTDLENVITSYPDKAPAMVEYINERSGWTTEALRNVAEHSTSLTKGVL